MICISSLRARISLLALTLAALGPAILLIHADAAADSHQHVSLRGAVRHVDIASNCLSIAGDDGSYYTVDVDNAAIILANIKRDANILNLATGMTIRVSGTLVSRSVIEADTVREVSDVEVKPAAFDGANRANGDVASVEGVVQLVDSDNGRITVADGDGDRVVVDTFNAAIALARNEPDGRTADLARGMRVRIDGTRLPQGRMVADNVRVVRSARDSDVEITSPAVPTPADAPLPAVITPAPISSGAPSGVLIPPSPDSQYVLAHLDRYTGILIDARHLPNILRSPSPAIYGPEPSESLLYPDRSDVPTPDEVQDETIVRYYHTAAEASNGVDGTNPLILPAQAVLGPAKDSLQLSADDMVLFNALEKNLHFSHTWKVGFLVPGDE